MAVSVVERCLDGRESNCLPGARAPAEVVERINCKDGEKVRRPMCAATGVEAHALPESGRTHRDRQKVVTASPRAAVGAEGAAVGAAVAASGGLAIGTRIEKALLRHRRGRGTGGVAGFGNDIISRMASFIRALSRYWLSNGLANPARFIETCLSLSRSGTWARSASGALKL